MDSSTDINQAHPTRYPFGLKNYVTQRLNYYLTTILIHIITIIHFALNFRCDCIYSTKPQLIVFNILFYLCTSASLLILAFSNPGWIQKPTRFQDNKIPEKNEFSVYDNFIIVYLNRVTAIKECEPCKIYRPPRAVHCGTCNCCTLRMDHHCPWIGTCVGSNNYKYFVCFISSLTAHLVTTIIGCLLVITSTKQGQSFGLTMSKYPLSIPILLLCIIFISFSTTLMVVHVYLISTGQTTNQLCKQRWKIDSGNPYSKNLVRNWVRFVIKGPSRKQEMERVVTRMVNSLKEEPSNNNLVSADLVEVQIDYLPMSQK